MKTHLNLISREFRLRQLVRQRVRQWLIILAVAVVAIGLVARDQWNRCQAAADQRAPLEDTYESTKHAGNSKTSLEKRIDVLKAEQALANSFTESQPEITAIGCVSQAAKNTRGDVFVRELTLTRTSRDIGPDAKGGEQIPNTVTLEGAGLNGVAVAHFVAGIRESDLFDRVELDSKERVWTGTRNIYPFRLSCTF